MFCLCVIIPVLSFICSFCYSFLRLLCRKTIWRGLCKLVWPHWLVCVNVHFNDVYAVRPPSVYSHHRHRFCGLFDFFIHHFNVYASFHSVHNKENRNTQTAHRWRWLVQLPAFCRCMLSCYNCCYCSHGHSRRRRRRRVEWVRSQQCLWCTSFHRKPILNRTNTHGLHKTKQKTQLLMLEIGFIRINWKSTAAKFSTALEKGLKYPQCYFASRFERKYKTQNHNQEHSFCSQPMMTSANLNQRRECANHTICESNRKFYAKITISKFSLKINLIRILSSWITTWNSKLQLWVERFKRLGVFTTLGFPNNSICCVTHSQQNPKKESQSEERERSFKTVISFGFAGSWMRIGNLFSFVLFVREEARVCLCVVVSFFFLLIPLDTINLMLK